MNEIRYIISIGNFYIWQKRQRNIDNGRTCRVLTKFLTMQRRVAVLLFESKVPTTDNNLRTQEIKGQILCFLLCGSDKYKGEKLNGMNGIWFECVHMQASQVRGTARVKTSRA